MIDNLFIVVLYTSAIWLALLAARHRVERGLPWYGAMMAITVVPGDLLLLFGHNLAGGILAGVYIVLLVQSARVLKKHGLM